MEGQRVLDLVGCLDAFDVAVWLDGGWGVDALLGFQTRPHDDLDLIARLEDVSRLEAALAEIDYGRVQGEPPLSFELIDPEGHQVDVHPVHFTANGEAIYRTSSGDDWLHLHPCGLGAACGGVADWQTPPYRRRASP